MSDALPGADSDPLNRDAILEEARRQSGLDDFGDPWFFEPMDKLLESSRQEARLSPAGVKMRLDRMVHGLVSRLRLIDALKRNPEILDESVTVAGVIVGLPRTGSTMFHRMLSVSPGINTIRWWETQFYAPFAGEARGDPAERRRAAGEIMDGYVKAGLMSVHPFAIDAPDEEIIIMDQFFVGTMPEAGMYIPSYSSWLGSFDHRPAYEDLKTILKYFQWQNPSRHGKRWVLKTPGHLPTLDALFAVFPETVVITTHRDPLQTVPSYCSMVCSLHGMATDAVDEIAVGLYTEKRWAGFLERYAEARERIGAHRFIDVKYEDLLKAPLEQARMVLGRLGIEMTPAVEDAMKEWLVENAREKRAAHHYTLDQFGLSTEQLERDFASYRARFLH